MYKTVTLYKPYDHQKAVHDAISKHIDEHERFTDGFQKIFAVVACRQVGKSTMAENELARFALQFSGSINTYISPKLDLAIKTMDEIVDMFEETGLILSLNKQRRVINFINGSEIRFFSGEQEKGLRGWTTSGVNVIDEAAFIKDGVFTDCISSWVDAKKAVTLMISTPQYKFGFFYDHYMMGLSGRYSVESCSFMDYDLSFIRTPERLEEKRLTVPEQCFKSEYLGLFLDAEGSVFGDFSICILDNEPEFEELYMGLDFGTGSGKDFTVLTALNERCEQVFIWRTNDMQPTEQVNEILRIVGLYRNKIKGFLAEENGVGKIYLDLIKKEYPLVNTFLTDNKSKRKIVEKLQVAIQNRTIRLLKDQHQTNQLSIFEAGVNRLTNKISYSAPNGFHDDDVIALMIALECFNRKKNGSFRVSFT